MKYGFQSEKEQRFPTMVLVETTNRCNMDCIHCPRKEYVKEPWFKDEEMDWALLEKITREVGEHGGYLRYSCGGDPLLYSKFCDSVEYARENGVKILSFNTNGLAMNPDKLGCLLKQNDPMAVMVEVSIDAFTKETYEKIRVGSSYDVVMKNIEGFLALRKARNSNAKLLVSMIDQPETRHELEDFENYWGKKADKVIIRKFVSVKDALDKKKEAFDTSKRWPCLLLWKRFSVSVDGQARFCIDDWKHESALPYNLKDHSIEHVWSSPEYDELREKHLNGDFKGIYCENCREWAVVKWDYSYEKAINELLGTSL